MDVALSMFEALVGFLVSIVQSRFSSSMLVRKQQSIAIAGYSVQACMGIPNIIGFFSKPSLDLCHFGECLQFLLVLFGIYGFVEGEVRLWRRLRKSTNASKMEGATCRGWI
jgi:hypothetical protein